MKKISELPSYTANTEDIWFVANNSGETETFKVNKKYINACAGYSWTNGSPSYFNFTNGADNYLPFNTEIFNNNSDVFELVNSGVTGNTGSRIYFKQPGIYEMNTQIHIYDMFNNVDVFVRLSSSSTSNGAMVAETLFSDFKAAELTSDRLLNSTLMFEVTSPKYYTVCVNPSANSPFPSDTESTPTRIFIKKVY